MYSTMQELLQDSEATGKALWEIILENEIQLTSKTEEVIFAELMNRYQVMCRSANNALDHGLETVGGLIKGVSARQYKYAKQSESLCGSFLNLVMARALSGSETNAAMGKVCAAPTAGACGILPAVLLSVGERYQLEERRILEGLLTASGIGGIIMQNATVSGAEGGCQAECGVAAAMAAAGAVYMMDGNSRQQVHAAALALIHVMGLICDPVAGLVQVPCAQRNASQAVNALLSADMALAGTESIIPPDEVVEAMYRVGKMLPMQLKETAQGGIAYSKTGKRIKQEIFGR